MAKKIEPPTETQYHTAKYNQAIGFAPPIRPCMKCQWPVVSGYCCSYCGDTNPTSSMN